MKFSNFFIFLILLVIAIFASGCPQSQKPSPASQQQINAPETPTATSSEKINPIQTSQQAKEQQTNARDDFGCWPPSCSYIPNPEGQQQCEDWKAGKSVQWQDCSIFMEHPACKKLCELEKASASAEQQKQQEMTEQTPKSYPPCNLAPLQRQFSNTPYYTGPLIDDHFHMPQMREIPNNPDAPVLDKDVSKHDVVCLFSDKERIKNVFAFYGVPLDLKEKSIQDAREIEHESPGAVIHFIELVSFPGYPVVPQQVEGILNANEGLFKGYGEISLYLPFYTESNVMPNDPTMKELYKIAEKHHLIVMMHLIESQQQAIEEVLRDFPNVKFLFHGIESLSWAGTLFGADLDKYPNAYYSVDIDLVKDAIFPATTKQDFINNMKQNWQGMLSEKVAFWKSRIEKHPNQFLWGTDRGHYAWHYDPEVQALLEEYGRVFIGQLDPAVQERYAYKNAEYLLQKR